MRSLVGNDLKVEHRPYPDSEGAIGKGTLKREVKGTGAEIVAYASSLY